jgi:diketogulonate reductase-like aldo/keto reductase
MVFREINNLFLCDTRKGIIDSFNNNSLSTSEEQARPLLRSCNRTFVMEKIPEIGFGAGTAWYKGYEHNIDNTPLDEEQIIQTVNALEVGFQHLDLAEMYGNDREVGEALERYFAKNTEKERGDLWITSKCSQHLENPILGCQEILSRLNCEYLDLYLLHCPVEFKKCSSSIETIWREMESLVEQKLVRYIGVSNFRISDLEELMSIARIPPFMNQVEFHPYLQQPDLREKCQSFGIHLSAYSPLGPLNLWPGGPIDPLLEELSEKYQRSSGVILLKYASQKGYIPITTSSKVERMIDCLSAFAAVEGSNSFQLGEEDIQRIDAEGSKQIKRKYWATNHDDSRG